MNTYSLSASLSMVRNIQINRHKSNSYHYVVQQETKKGNTPARRNNSIFSIDSSAIMRKQKDSI